MVSCAGVCGGPNVVGSPIVVASTVLFLVAGLFAPNEALHWSPSGCTGRTRLRAGVIAVLLPGCAASLVLRFGVLLLLGLFVCFADLCGELVALSVSLLLVLSSELVSPAGM